MTDWIPISELAVGDRIRIPGGSSRAYWRDRAEAEASMEPFREVVRTRSARDPALQEVLYADGTYSVLPRSVRVLRA